MAAKNKTLSQRVAEINKFLAILTAANGKIPNTVLIKRHKIEQSHFYTMKKKLIATGRVNSANVVQDTAPIAQDEYIQIGDPYKKVQKALEIRQAARKTKKKVAKKKRKVGQPVLTETIAVPVMEHPTGATITISIPVKELVNCFLQMIRTGGIA